jgi:L-ascorbate metabolism protein UlaG (beta-lactamase superfamily)
MAVTIRFLGHSAFMVESGDFRVAIDPFLTGNPSAEAAGIKAVDLNPTHIAITHGHEDHIGDAPAIAKRTGAQVIAPYEICEWFQSEHKHENCNPGGTGGRVATDFGCVDFTRADHSSSYGGIYMGTASGLVLSIGGTEIYHAGDTALFSDMKLIGEQHKPDIAILPVGDRFTMGPAQAKLAAEWIGAKSVIPCHYGTWDVLASDISAFAPAGIEVKALKPGETLSV